MIVCADSSFLVSAYIADAHSMETDRRLFFGQVVTLTPLNRAEFAHVVHQLVFRKAITPSHAKQAWGDFEEDWNRRVWSLVDFPGQTWQTSIDLAHRYGPALGVRTLDSLHVACALELNAEKFWTFDDRQQRLAESVGLDTGA